MHFGFCILDLSSYTAIMFQRLREWLTVILIVALPFHALLVTFGTKVIAGPGHAPLPYIAVWKEALLAIVLLLAAVEFFRKRFKKKIIVDRLDILILVLIAISIAVTMMTHGDWKMYLFGFKYDFIPLVAFLVLRRVKWSEAFHDSIYVGILVVAGIVATYGIISFFLPQSFFTKLGYSDLHSLYVPEGPLASYQQIGDTGIRRIQSTFSGPNQFGLWLLIPISLTLTAYIVCRSFISKFVRKVLSIFFFMHEPKRCMHQIFLFFLVFALLLTASRSAWIAGIVIVIVTLWSYLSGPRFRKILVRLIGVGVILFLLGTFFLPDVFWRYASSRDHLARPTEAMQTIVENPLGLGLGSAGPASNRVSDPCVYLEEGADASWAEDRQDLCVFVGDEQVQPTDRDCACPLLPENWYLQIGVEFGLLGLVLYVVLIYLILCRLYVGKHEEFIDEFDESTPIFLAFLGVSVAALFLHAWEEAAVAYTLWVLAAINLVPKRIKKQD